MEEQESTKRSGNDRGIGRTDTYEGPNSHRGGEKKIGTCFKRVAT